MKLGEILVKHGLLSHAQLVSALTHQQAQGSRLGTFLVEKSILTSDQVALALSEQFGVPPALETDFLRADATLRKRMVVHQAIELQAIPLYFLNPRRVAVAMANPTNARAIDRLAFILGATVAPMVTPEVALRRQFEILYKLKRRNKTPVLALGQKVAQKPVPKPAPKTLVRPGPRRPDPEASEIRPALRSYRQRPATPKLAPLKPGIRVPEPAAPITMMEDALCFTPTPLSALPRTRVPTPPTPTRVLSRHPLTPVVVPITSASAHLAVEQIRLATDQQDLSDNLFTFMRTCFGIGAMFVVAGAMAQGLFGFSDGRVCAGIEKLRFSLSLPSCFRIARSRRATFRGSPPPDGGAVHRPLWAALHCPPPADVLVSPVIVDGLVTLLLYAQGEGGSRLNDVAAANVEHVCEALSSSLLRLAV
jgi:hypothetical protein